MKCIVKIVLLCSIAGMEFIPLKAENPGLPAVMGLFKKKKKAPEKKDTTNAYDKFKKGSKITEGMFNVIQKNNDYYFEIPVKLLKKDLLVVNKLRKVPSELNDAGVNRGIDYQNQMVSMEWDKNAKRILFRQERPMPSVPENDAIARSVKNNYISPLIASFPVEQVSKDSTHLIIKVNDIYNGTETSINNVFSNINLGTSAIRNLSRICSVKSFKDNVVAVSELTTKVTERNESVFVTVEVSSSLMLLPDKPMTGRFDNPKVGYFTNSLLHFSDKQQEVDKQHFITRWRLEPKPEARQAYLKGQLVEPAKPIVFYIDAATPYQWRKYIKQGIEDWNIAFEKAGFKNAIIARQVTDSMNIDDDDVDYSVFTYAASEKKNAMGPSLLDPRSGEILEADIMCWHNVLSMVRNWIMVQTGAVDKEARTVQLPEKLMGDALRFVVCHEVGHSLGLRHNMIASYAFPTDSLRSASFTNKMGATAASIMDYARFNYVAQPGDGVKLLSPHIGPYDIFAIEYGYRWYGKSTPEEEQPLLYDFLQAHKGKMYRYSEAQDARGAVDPRAQMEDLGDDAVRSSELGIANLKRIVPNIIKWTTTGEKGQTYEKASSFYYEIVSQWNNYLYHVMANIGGIYINNTTVGDGQQTYTYVEKAKQQQALQFLIKEALAYPAWLFDTEASKFTYFIRPGASGTTENAPSQIFGNAQSYVLWDLLSNDRLVRMLENEAANGKKAFTAVEMMDMLHKSIFRITEQGGQPDVRTRRLQKNFLDALITAAAESESVKINKKLNPFLTAGYANTCFETEQRQIAQERMAGPRTLNFYGSQLNRISDAISVKRGEMLRIKKLLQNRLAGANTASRYHYEDMILRINTALGIK